MESGPRPRTWRNYGSEGVRRNSKLRSVFLGMDWFTLAHVLISLIGIPPFAGFIGKLLIFYSLVEAKLWTLLVIAGLNTAVSLYYYLRVIKIMTIDPEPAQRLPATMSFIPGAFVVAVTIPLFALFIGWDSLNAMAQAAAQQLF